MACRGQEYIYKVRSQAKKEGLVFPESQEKPSAETQSDEADALPSPRTTKVESARRPSMRRRHEEHNAEIAQSLKDLEYKASMYPKSRVDYAFEHVPRKNPTLWWNFYRTVLDLVKAREAVAEALELLTPFEERQRTAIVRKEPPPEIYDYVVEALGAWIVRFKEEKRGRLFPRGVLNPICPACTERIPEYPTRLRVPEVYPSPLEELGRYQFWCRYCWTQLSYVCEKCDSKLYPVKRPGADVFDAVCSGCGFTLDLSKEIRVHPSKMREGKLFWAIFFKETAKEKKMWQKSEMADDTTLLKQFRSGLKQLERWEKNPKVFSDSDTLTKGLISCGFGIGKLGITDDIVLRYFGTIQRTERWESDWKKYLKLSDEN